MVCGERPSHGTACTALAPWCTPSAAFGGGRADTGSLRIRPRASTCFSRLGNRPGAAPPALSNTIRPPAIFEAVNIPQKGPLRARVCRGGPLGNSPAIHRVGKPKGPYGTGNVVDPDDVGTIVGGQDRGGDSRLSPRVDRGAAECPAEKRLPRSPDEQRETE